MVAEGEEGEKEEKRGNADADDDAVTTGNRDLKDGLKDVMISWIKWYRNTLSPIMPPNCRFFPSCSVYAIDAIEKFGSVKGGVLTGWRILRCNPLGGAGYDPPQWPPPGFRAGTNTKRW
jgi:putative membrane protein insertion efficiency factor